MTSDALWTRTSSETTDQLAASDSDATRLRLGLEGSYRMALEGGGSLVPKLEIGARHDGGDAETGFGVEIGGGIAWSDPALGLSLDVSGRTLIAHGNDDLKDRGYAASLAFDPDPATQRGPSLSLRQEFGGPAQGGLRSTRPSSRSRRAGRPWCARRIAPPDRRLPAPVRPVRPATGCPPGSSAGTDFRDACFEPDPGAPDRGAADTRMGPGAGLALHPGQQGVRTHRSTTGRRWGPRCGGEARRRHCDRLPARRRRAWPPAGVRRG